MFKLDASIRALPRSFDVTPKAIVNRVLLPLLALSLVACSRGSSNPTPGPELTLAPEPTLAPESTALAAATAVQPARAAQQAEPKSGCWHRPGYRKRAAARLIRRLDRNGSGVLETSEFPSGSRDWWRAADSNEDKRVTVEELADHNVKPKRPPKLSATIAKLDKNGNGALDLAELTERNRKKYASADTNKDQQLSIEELRAHEERRAEERCRADEKEATQSM